MKIDLICPSERVTNEEEKQILEYVAKLESEGHKVFYPDRDNPHEKTDLIGYKICQTNLQAKKDNDIVHVWWNPTSTGSLFDIGMAVALEKQIILVNSVKDGSWPPKVNKLSFDEKTSNLVLSDMDYIKRHIFMFLKLDRKSPDFMFRFGVAFALNKKVVITNTEVIRATDGKSFENLYLYLNRVMDYHL